MVELVDPTLIESIVGAKRDPKEHYGRAVTESQTFYILHSGQCLKEYSDLCDCPFSRALGHYGIDVNFWLGYTNVPVKIGIERGVLVPKE